MEKNAPTYNVTIAGQNMKLVFVPEESPTKAGINMRFVMEKSPKDKQALSDKISLVLQKKFGESGVAVAFNDRNPYENVISFIVPMDSIAEVLMRMIK